MIWSQRPGQEQWSDVSRLIAICASDALQGANGIFKGDAWPRWGCICTAGAVSSSLRARPARSRPVSGDPFSCLCKQEGDAIAAIYQILKATITRFLDHDCWALASHIAMSILMALFPFIIVIASLASLIGTAELANSAAGLLFEIWPSDIAAPLSGEIRTVLTERRSGALTIGALFALYFASNGIEALRIGLNRAYGAVEWRAWYWTRLESILFVLVAAAGLVIFAVFVVLWPVIWNALMAWAPTVEAQLQPLRFLVSFVRYAVTGIVMFVVLTAAHMLVAAGRRSFRQVLPGVILTIVAWFVGGAVFGIYIADFGQKGYVTMYAGLASVAIALVFLYVLGAIFLLGGELNATLIDREEMAA